MQTNLHVTPFSAVYQFELWHQVGALLVLLFAQAQVSYAALVDRLVAHDQ